MNHLLVIGGSNGNPLSNIELVNETTTLPCTIPQYPFALFGHATAATTQTVVTCGGYGSGGGYLKDCNQLGQDGRIWQNGPSMQEQRYLFSLTALNNKQYAIGGEGSRNTMETRTMETNWVSENIPFSVEKHCTTKYSDHELIVLGGRQSGRVSKSKILIMFKIFFHLKTIFSFHFLFKLFLFNSRNLIRLGSLTTELEIGEPVLI